MGQVFSKRGGTVLKLVTVPLTKGLYITVNCDYSKAEEDVGLPESVEIRSLEFSGDVLDLLEWSDAQKGKTLQKIEELTLQFITD